MLARRLQESSQHDQQMTTRIQFAAHAALQLPYSDRHMHKGATAFHCMSGCTAFGEGSRARIRNGPRGPACQGPKGGSIPAFKKHYLRLFHFNINFYCKLIMFKWVDMSEPLPESSENVSRCVGLRLYTYKECSRDSYRICKEPCFDCFSKD